MCECECVVCVRIGIKGVCVCVYAHTYLSMGSVLGRVMDMYSYACIHIPVGTHTYIHTLWICMIEHTHTHCGHTHTLWAYTHCYSLGLGGSLSKPCFILTAVGSEQPIWLRFGDLTRIQGQLVRLQIRPISSHRSSSPCPWWPVGLDAKVKARGGDGGGGRLDRTVSSIRVAPESTEC